MYILDTDTCIFICRGDKNVLTAFARTMKGEVFISILTQFELEVGYQKATVAREMKRAHMDRLFQNVSILPFEKNEVLHAAKVRASLEKKGQSIGAIDNLIAGTALANNLTLITGNQKEFGRVKGLKTEDWISR